MSELGSALALDALEPAERDFLEAHIRRCPDCARELAELRQVAAQLALGLPQHEPPAALRERIMALAARDTVTEQRSGGATERVAPPPRSWWRRWAAGLSLASLAVALAALLWAASLQAQLGQAQRQVAESGAQLERIRANYFTIASVLASPQLEVRELQPAESVPGASGKVWVDRGSGRGMMMARGLPDLAQNQAFQVWLSNAQGRVSAGLLRANDEDVYYLVLQAPGKLTDYQRLGVTIEPSSGSPGPTGPRVIGGEI